MAAARHQQQRAEPMNASPSHPKVKVSLAFSERVYVAGGAITGKMELEARADKGLGLGIIMVELVAIEELTSRDHNATSVFLHSRRVYQGPGVPPSNAVLPHALAGDAPLPAGYLPARKGRCGFLFKLPVPEDSPGSIAFGNGLARVKYEVRATVGVVWKGEKRLVSVKEEVELLEAQQEEAAETEGVVVGEGGKIWVQAQVVGGLVVAGESACVQLHVKNQSSRKSAGIHLSITRHLRLPATPGKSSGPPLELSDTLTTVSFKGPEYAAPPGQEGVATLVFDVPARARTVHSRPRHGGDATHEPRDALFAVDASLNIRIAMPMGSKDIELDLPVCIYHPAVLPEPDDYNAAYPPLPMSPAPPPMSPNPYERAMSPYQQPYPGQLWSPAPMQMPLYTGMNPHAMLYSPPPPDAYYFAPPPQHMQPPMPPPRPASAEPPPSAPIHGLAGVAGLPPAPSAQHPVLMHSLSSGTLNTLANQAHEEERERDEHRGVRERRVSHHLRFSSRGRSASPTGRRQPEPQALSPHTPSPRVPAASLSPTSPSQPRDRRPSLSLGPLSPVSFAGPGSAEVASPRPMPSPKMAVLADPLATIYTGGSLGKTARVAHLEAVAALAPRDMSGDAASAKGEEQEEELSVAELLAAHESAFRAVALEDKTLPGPPVPTGKPGAAAHAAAPADVQALFSGAPEPRTPTLSALTLLKPPAGAGAAAQAGLLMPKGGASGLDALERRLLAEVGTRKFAAPARVDVRALGMDMTPAALALDVDTTPDGLRIPPGRSDEAVNDSAISSLSLGAEGVWDHMRAREEEKKVQAQAEPAREDDELSEGRTHRAASSGDERRTTRKSGGERERSGAGAGASTKKRSSRGKDGERERSKASAGGSGHSTKDKEALRLRRAAKGRVAEWLGRVDAQSPPLPAPEVPASDSPAASPRVAEEQLAPEVSARRRKSSAASRKEEAAAAVKCVASQQRIVAEEQVPAVPPVPAAHHPAPVQDRAEDPKTQRTPTIPSAAAPSTAKQPETKPPAAPEPEPAKRAPDSRSSGFVPMATIRARASAFKPPAPNAAQPVRARWEAALAASSLDGEPKPAHAKPAVVRKLSSAGKAIPAYLQPQPGSDGPKYDIRSARGGRGGRVTAVTALWAGLTEAEQKAAEAAERENELARKFKAAATRPQALLKNTGGKAAPAVSSSAAHAAPHLSSTASLSRPVPARTRAAPRIPMPPAIAEEPAAAPAPVLARVTSSGSARKVEPAPAGAEGEAKEAKADLAFGQARLRELIRRYQGAGQA